MMISGKRLSCIVLFVVACAHVSLAQEVVKKPSPFRVFLDAALEFGGDDVAEVHFLDGNTQSVKAGQGLSVALGGEYRLPKAEQFALRAAAGYKYVTTMADNANIRLTRFPLYLTANWMPVKKLRLGAGIANHQHIQFKADGWGSDIKLTGSTGPLFEAAFRGFALRYTVMKYKDQDNYSYSANSIGLSISGFLNK